MFTDLTPREIDQVLASYEGWLRKRAGALVSGGDYADVVQEGRIALWLAWQSHVPAKGPLVAWLTMKADFRMRDVATKRLWTGQPVNTHRGDPQATRRSSMASVEAMQDSTDEVVAMLGSVEIAESVIWAYHHGEIQEALSALSPRQREYVQARFWEGMTPTDLKARWGYDPTSLWSSAKNGAKHKLAESLAPLHTLVSS